MSARFFTIKEPATGEYKEKGSKFLAFAFPVSSEDEVKEKQEELRKKYFDARHHCYAYILGKEEQHTRANDDGEPGHSAGDPILGQIKSAELTNVLVVVVRYFGGTKLGVSGLINAYRTAAQEAIFNSTIIEIFTYLKAQLTFEYDELGTVENWMTDLECQVIERDFQTSCRLVFEIKKVKQEQLKHLLQDHYMIKLTIDED